MAGQQESRWLDQSLNPLGSLWLPLGCCWERKAYDSQEWSGSILSFQNRSGCYSGSSQGEMTMLRLSSIQWPNCLIRTCGPAAWGGRRSQQGKQGGEKEGDERSHSSTVTFNKFISHIPTYNIIFRQLPSFLPSSWRKLTLWTQSSILIISAAQRISLP